MTPPVGAAAPSTGAVAPGAGAVALSSGAVALGAGAVAPAFELPDQNNQVVRLADFRGARAVLLVFYPFAFTGTCQSELAHVRDHLDDFQNDRVQVLTVSVDTVYAHKVWAERERYEFPLLSDFWPHGAVALSYGVFNAATGAASRGTFLIDPDGVIRFAERLSPGVPRGPEVWQAALGSLS
jgi:peroxiredoxin (alkyl hydroperoxide reductase subunit C)